MVKIPKNIHPAIPKRNPDRALQALAQSNEILTGATGNGLDKALTLRDLQQLGLVDFSMVQGRFTDVQLVDDGGTDAMPMTPTGVELHPTFNTVLVKWDRVTLDWYDGTEIYRVLAELNNADPENPYPYIDDGEGGELTPSFSNAVLVGTTFSPFFTDYLPPNTTAVYWVRHLNHDDVASDLHDIYGSWTTTYRTPLDVLIEYSKEVYDGENYQWLRSDMGMMDTLNRLAQNAFGSDSQLAAMIANNDSLADLLAEQSMSDALDKHTTMHEIKAQFSRNYAKLSGGIHAAVGEVEAYVNRIIALEAFWDNGGEYDQRTQAKLDSYQLTLASPDGAIATQIDSYKVNYEGNEVTLDQLSAAVANNKGEYYAQWGVKTNVNGLQGGVGFFNDGQSTSFVVDASTFAVTGGNTDPNGVLPFIVKDNKVVMKTALIDHADIYTLIAANITAENIKASVSFESPVINGGSITGTTLDINGKMMVDATGYMFAVGALLKDLTITDAAGNPILDSNGIDGTYIKDLTVDTLSIADNAITASSTFSIANFIIGKNTTVTRQTAVLSSHQSDNGAYILANITAACKRTSTGGGNDKIFVTATIYDDTNTSLESRTLTVGIPNDSGSYHFIPFMFIVNTTKPIYIKITANSQGENWEVETWGALHSAKK